MPELVVEPVEKRTPKTSEWIYKTRIVLNTNKGIKTCFGEAATVERLAFEGETNPDGQFNFFNLVNRRHIQVELDTAAIVYKLRLDIAPHANATGTNSAKVGVEPDTDYSVFRV